MKKGQAIVVIAAVFILLTWAIWGILVFGEHKVTGRASSAVATIGLTVLGACDQQINLTGGWNFISLYVRPGNYSVESVLSPIVGYYEYLQEWDASTQDFKVWSKYGLKQFTEFNQNKSYFIYLSTSNLLALNGDCFGNWTINISSGWETPDYVYEYPTNITGAGVNQFANVTLSYMQKWNASNQDFLAYSPSAAVNPFNSVNASEGYLILTSGGQLVYVRS